MPGLRVGLGCMRLPTGDRASEQRALETVAAAANAGITVFDTARSYGSSEHLLVRALRACGHAGTARIVTKGGMARPAGAWVPDGRAKAIRADCEASLEALDGLRSTSTSSTLPTRERRGGRRCARSPGSSTMAWCRASVSRTCTAVSWTRPSSWLRSPLCRLH